jgi:hypothetical protein
VRAFGAGYGSTDRQFCARLSSSDGEEPPGSVDALKFVVAAVLELEACSGDEHRHRGGDHEFAGWGGFEDAGGDVDCDSGDVGASDLDLAGVLGPIARLRTRAASLLP